MSASGEPFTLAAVHALHLADVVQRLGVAREALLAPLGLREEALAEPGARLSIAQLEALVARARALTGEEAIGIRFGMEMRISAHGYLGFAAMTASTVREALELASRFVPTRTNALAIAVHEKAGLASIVVEERADFGTARDAVIFALAVGIWQIGRVLTGRTIEGSVDFAFPEPPYFARFAALSPGARFGQPVNQLLFDARALDLPLTMADPASRRLAIEQCERSLEALGAHDDMVERVRRLVLKDDRGVRSLEEVASAVRVSPRTLKRRLAERGLTFSDVLEERRREAALLLLRAKAPSLDAIAEQLGYSDTANFRRAFRRWTGMSPAAYRRGEE